MFPGGVEWADGGILPVLWVEAIWRNRRPDGMERRSSKFDMSKNFDELITF